MKTDSIPSSSHARGKEITYPIGDNDRISKLPNDILQKILARLSTEKVIRTSVLSKRWVDLWKWRLHLFLDMRKLPKPTPVSVHLVDSVTKTVENHRGHLESCVINHYVSQSKDDTLQSLIHTVTRVKRTKSLTLVSHMGRGADHMFLQKTPEEIDHHSLTSLSLINYHLLSKRVFTNCCNLKTLKLLNIRIAEASFLSNVFKLCPSLEVIVLDIDSVCSIFKCGVLKIENKNLKFLQVTSSRNIERIEVYAPSLAILDIRFIGIKIENFILDAPNVRFNRNYWIAGGFPRPHLSYDISDLAQEKKGIWHELMVTEYSARQEYTRFLSVSEFSNKRSRHGSLSVSVDLTNPKEVEILKEVLLMWSTEEMKELEIFFKKNANAPREEGDAHTKLWEDEKPFPNDDFRVTNVRMYNLEGSNKEEFALASHFVMQKMVTKKLMIETSSCPPMKKLEIEAAVGKLMELPKGNKNLSIECF